MGYNESEQGRQANNDAIDASRRARELTATQPDYYLIHATVNILDNGYTLHRDVPSFCLPVGTLGIVSAKHARQIARDILKTAVTGSQRGRVMVHVTAAAVEV